MADVINKKTVSQVFVSEAEMANMLGEKALAASLIDFTPDAVEIMPGASGDPAVQGWVVTFKVEV